MIATILRCVSCYLAGLLMASGSERMAILILLLIVLGFIFEKK